MLTARIGTQQVDSVTPPTGPRVLPPGREPADDDWVCPDYPQEHSASGDLYPPPVCGWCAEAGRHVVMVEQADIAPQP